MNIKYIATTAQAGVLSLWIYIHNYPQRVIASEQRERGNPDWIASSAKPPRNDVA